jgi:transcriptional regulator with XRE-family HTH domain
MPTSEQIILQQLLKQVRIEQGLNQKDLAALLGKHQSFVSKYENGERRLDILELRQLCRTIQIPFDEFIARLETAISHET